MKKIVTFRNVMYVISTYFVTVTLVPCQDYFFKRKTVDTPECQVCGATDNLVHFFVACPTVHTFLGRIKNCINNVLEYDVEELSDKDNLLGLVGGGESGRTVNYIFLWAKLYI